MKKIFFDTNFLLRFYLDDIPAQALIGRRMVQAAKDGEILLVTDLIVICEMVWELNELNRWKKYCEAMSKLFLHCSFNT